MRVPASCALVLLTAAVAGAQTPSTSARPPPSAVSWSVAAGYASFWLRDVSRTTTRVDASPVTWTGDGPALEGLYERWRPGRLHRVEVVFASASRFTYDTPVRQVERPAGDGATHVGGRYEYRRYPFRDVGLTGFDIGIGVEGGAEMFWWDRHLAPAIAIGVTGRQFETGVVAAAHLQRSRLDAQVLWINGATIGRTVTTHSAAEQWEDDGWGGGWLTDLHLRASVRVAARTSLVASYLTTGRGRYASHDAVALGRSRVVLGVVYAR